jgi:hypothetical protein
MLFSGAALAQVAELPAPGMMPGSPFFFIDRLFESIGDVFTFGQAAKARRAVRIAEERLSEARALAERGDVNVQTAIELYEEKVVEASERAQNARDVETLALVIKTKSTPQHLMALEDVMARVPEQAKPAVQRAIESRQKQWLPANFRVLQEEDSSRAVGVGLEVLKARVEHVKVNVDRDRLEDAERAADDFQELLAIVSDAPRGSANLEAKFSEGLTGVMEEIDKAETEARIKVTTPSGKVIIRKIGKPTNREQLNSLGNLAMEDPAKAVEIFARAVESRLNAVKEDVEAQDAVGAAEALESYREYAAFGKEISVIAQGIRVGETTVEELVKAATAHHLQVLEGVRQRIPAEAQQEFQRAIDSARRVQEPRPAIPAPTPARPPRPEIPPTPRIERPEQPGIPRPPAPGLPEQPVITPPPRLEERPAPPGVPRLDRQPQPVPEPAPEVRP